MRQITSIVLLLFCSFALAADKTILTLKLGDRVINLSYQDILEFTPVEHTMKNVWVNKTVTYTGVKLSTIIQKYNITSEWLKMTAINDYSIKVPIIDAEKGAFIAYLADGKPMKIRDKGPLWVLYPFGENEELEIDTYHNRSIWQLKLIEESGD
jgi:hypothetical protein